MGVQEFELPGITELRVAVFRLLFYYCVYRTCRPRCRTQCCIGRLKSPCEGEGRELEKASKSKNLRNIA
jgi:hypothetical protein